MCIHENDIEIEPKIFKIIEKRAEKENTTVDKLINDIVRNEIIKMGQ